jgi:hypothetical protein
LNPARRPAADDDPVDGLLNATIAAADQWLRAHPREAQAFFGAEKMRNWEEGLVSSLELVHLASEDYVRRMTRYMHR